LRVAVKRGQTLKSLAARIRPRIHNLSGTRSTILATLSLTLYREQERLRKKLEVVNYLKTHNGCHTIQPPASQIGEDRYE
jgi:hypothetical protein